MDRGGLMEGRAHGGVRYRDPSGRIQEAIIAIADADAEDDRAYHAAWVRFWKALADTGWRAPCGRRNSAAMGEQLRFRWRETRVASGRH